MRILLLGVTALLLLPAARAAHAGACAPGGWEAEMLTKPGQVIPSGGGIIAGVRPGMYEQKPPPNPAVRNWVLRSGKKSIPLIAEELAPGLARYRPKRPAAAGAWSVQPRKRADVKRTGPDKPVSFAQAGITPLAPPAGASVHTFTRTLTNIAPHGGSRTIQTVAVRLAHPAPPRALGLILYEGKTDAGAPMLFRRSGAGLRDVVMFSTPGRCQPRLRTWRRPSAGQQVRVAWIDHTGTLSARSTPIVVAGTPPPPLGAAPGEPTLPSDVPPPPGASATKAKAPAPAARAVAPKQPAPAAPKQPAPPAKKSNKGCSSSTDGGGVVFLLGALLLLRRRRSSASAD